MISTGSIPVTNPANIPPTAITQPSNTILKESVTALYSPSTPVKSYPMDIDSGTPIKVEAMDISESTGMTPMKSQTAADNLFIEDFLHATLTKILHVSLKPEKNCIVIPSLWPNHPLMTNVNFLSHQQISQTISDLLMESFDLIMNATDMPTQLFLEGSSTNCLQYLCDCYTRMGEHEKKFSKKCNTTAVRELLANIKTELCAALALLLEGFLTEPVKRNYYEMLFELLKTHSLPTEFFYDFVNHLESDAVRFNKIFSPLLLIIRNESQIGSVSDGSHQAALQVLADLCECRTGANSSTRPFCNLMIKLGNWLVDPLTEAIGREFAKFTYLGPFLCTSLFAEDDASMAEKFKSIPNEAARPVVTSMQQEIELTRNLLHKVVLAYCVAKGLIVI